VNKADDFSINMGWDFPNKRKYATAFALLFFSLILIYSNSFDCSLHFDDFSNITVNQNIQITDLSWENIEKGLYGVIGSSRWQRPVSYFSFALNYYFGGLDVFGYHLVNFFIHFSVAFFLFLFIYHTLQLPMVRDRYGKSAYSIALLSAFLWAVNPVQVAAVTYIVQRMASMAALFYLMAMFFYLKGRTSDAPLRKTLFFLSAFFSGVLACGTKENAAMLPMAIFLYDLFLIRGVTKENFKRSLKYGSIAVLAVVAIGLLYIGEIPKIVSDYEIRSFTMAERLLTQPRVLLFYVSLLLYPITSRMMLIHDIDISTSLFTPWTTLPALLAVILIIVAALYMVRKRPLIAYCIVFFFLNHIIEGSFIALELVYEHRNYLPSMLFFLPLAIIIIRGLQYFSNNGRMFLLLNISIIAILIIQGVTVYIQNNIYKDDISLWSDNSEKAPRLHRVHQNLATAYFTAGRLEEAFKEANLALETSLESYQAANRSSKCRTYGLLGEYYFSKGDDDRALIHHREALRLDPSYHTSYRRIAEIMVRKNRLEEGEVWIRKGIAEKPTSYAYHAILARILLKRGFPDEAIKEARISLALNGNQSEPYAVISQAFRIKKNDALADHFQRIGSLPGLEGPDIQATPLLMQAAT
jgi:protein O-mannosyl-transferase